MLSTMVMHLKRDTFARLYGQSLNLIAASRINRVIFTPGTINFAVSMMFMTAVCFDRFDNFLHILNGVTIGNQYSILGLHNDQIFHPNSSQ